MKDYTTLIQEPVRKKNTILIVVGEFNAFGGSKTPLWDQMYDSIKSLPITEAYEIIYINGGSKEDFDFILSNVPSLGSGDIIFWFAGQSPRYPEKRDIKELAPMATLIASGANERPTYTFYKNEYPVGATAELIVKFCVWDVDTINMQICDSSGVTWCDDAGVFHCATILIQQAIKLSQITE